MCRCLKETTFLSSVVLSVFAQGPSLSGKGRGSVNYDDENFLLTSFGVLDMLLISEIDNEAILLISNKSFELSLVIAYWSYWMLVGQT